MIIHSEQEMLTFGTNFAKSLMNSSTSAGDAAGGTPIARSLRARWGQAAAAGPAESTIIELIGDVGTGKTTFVRGLAQGLGIKEPVTSPSFTISKSYAIPQGGRLIHYDFYRLDDPGLMTEDLRDSIKDPANIVVIEWGNSVSDMLPDNHIVIQIQYNNDNTRTVKSSVL